MDVRTPIPSNGGDLLTKFGESWNSQIEALKAKFGALIEEVRMPRDYPTDVPIVYVKKDSIVEVIAFAKDGPFNTIFWRTSPPSTKKSILGLKSFTTFTRCPATTAFDSRFA